jgi:hypothetical protein
MIENARRQRTGRCAQVMKKPFPEDIKKMLGECKIGSPEGYVPPEGWYVAGHSLSYVVLYHRREGWEIEEREGLEQNTAYPGPDRRQTLSPFIMKLSCILKKVF